ncbi:MAG: cyanoexosortase B system-associated protein [Synechococcales cyanobacterium CRU_2_2]|nr:cyanoexosortase B system-associated protein [Synechococcales cyanobacterium CRU_2_2]
MTLANRRPAALPLPQLVVLLLLLGLLLFGTASSYLRGQWSWQKAPEVSALKQLGNLQKRGLELPGWSVVEKIDAFPIGGHSWVAKQLQATGSSPISANPLPANFQPWVLLRAQLASHDMPQMDWTDIQGQFRWSEDDVRRISLTTPSGSQIEARFARGWQPGGAYAVVEWYAWPGGGSPEPGDWFWRDRAAQLKGNRVPWVAAAVLMPMPPGAELDSMQPLAEAMLNQVQAGIEAAIASAKALSQ